MSDLTEALEYLSEYRGDDMEELRKFLQRQADHIEQLEWGYEAACNTLEARDKEIGQLEARVKELETQLHNLLMSRGGTWIFMPNSERPQPPEEET